LGPGNSGNTSATVTAGGDAVFNLTLTSTNYTGTVTYACAGAPVGDTCKVAPPTANLTPAAASASVAVTVQTAATNAMIVNQNQFLLGMLPWVGVLLAAPLWFKQKRLGGIAAFLLATAALVTLSACGSGSGGGNTTPPPATYKLTLTATGSGSITPATATLTLTVH